MFDASQYDVLDIQVPPKGMNQNVSPERLDMFYAYILENIIPQPLGEGRVRYGTDKLAQFVTEEEYAILKQFPYVGVGGVEQVLLYVRQFTLDATAAAFTSSANNSRQFSFTTNNVTQYIRDTPIQVEYTWHGQNTVYDVMGEVSVAGQTVTVTLVQNAFPPMDVMDDPVITGVFYPVGNIYLYDVPTKTIGQNPLRTNLAVACVPRWVAFAGKLYICNGVDRVMVWDGNALTDVFQFLKESATNLTRIDQNNLRFQTGDLFNIQNYAAGSLIQVVVNGLPTSLTITQRVLNVNILTVTVAENIPVFVQNRTELLYQAFVPRFNFMFVMYDRIWALGAGAASLKYRSPDQAMRVYFMYKPGASMQWFNEQLKIVPSINLAENHGIADNLEAISFLNGFMLFIGREKTQAWSGSEPVGGEVAQNKPVLQFHSELPVGAVHGDLVLSVANDVFMVAKTGLQSLSTLNVAKQFSVNSYDAVDPLIKQYVSTITRSEIAYRACASFKYDGGSLAGFKIGFNNILCSLFSTSFYAWTLFTGDFREATAFCVLGNSFYIAVQNILYKYGDGNDGSLPIYGDEGGTCPVFFSWSLPVIQFKGRAYAGLYYDLNMSYPSSFAIRKGNNISMIISGDLPKSYTVSNLARFDLRGDSLATIPLTQLPSNVVTPNDLGFRLDQPYHIYQDKFKFIARNFWVTLRGWTMDGVLSFKGMRIYGTLERKR